MTSIMEVMSRVQVPPEVAFPSHLYTRILAPKHGIGCSLVSYLGNSTFIGGGLSRCRVFQPPLTR